MNKRKVSIYNYIFRTVSRVAPGSFIISMMSSFVIGLEPTAFWTNVLICTSIGTVLGAFVGANNYKRSVQPMTVIIEHIEKMADGNFKDKLEDKKLGELKSIAQPINEMSENWGELIEQVMIKVSDLTDELVQNTEELHTLSTNAKFVSSKINKDIELMQTQSTEQEDFSSSNINLIEGMSHNISNITETSQYITESAINSAKESEDGNNTVQNAVKQMQFINNSVETLSTVIKQLELRSKEIENFVEVIRNIASQTSLLSLNATIEAARAGEEGRGFSVVATEIRKLAEQSENSAKEIANTINLVNSDITNVVSAMNKGKDEVQVGIKVVNQAGLSFKSILDEIQNISAQMEELTASTEEITNNSHKLLESGKDVHNISINTKHKTKEIYHSTEEQLSDMNIVINHIDKLQNMTKDLSSLTKKFNKFKK